MASRQSKSPTAFRTISEVADQMGVPQHVLRFWESKFSQIKPMKRGGGRRYYRPEDVEVINAIRTLLHEEGYTIKGAQKLLREHGVKAVIENTNTEQTVSNIQKISNDVAIKPVSEKTELKGQLMDIRDRLEKIRKSLKGELPN